MKKASYKRRPARRAPKKKLVNGVNVLSLETRFSKRTQCQYILQTSPYCVYWTQTAGSPTMGANNPVGLAIGTARAYDIMLASAGGPTFYELPFTLVFRLDSCINSNQITPVFDKYKLVGVKVTFRTNGAVPLSSGVYPQTNVMVSKYNKDYADNQTAQNNYDNQNDILVFGPTGVAKPIYRKPQPAMMLSRATSTGYGTAYSQGNSGWIDTSYPSVEHYSVTGLWRGIANTSQNFLQIDVQHLYEFRDQL